MIQVNVPEAQTWLPRLLNRLMAGEEVIIAEDGKPVARLVPIHPPATRRPLGIDADGDWYVADDFDAPLADDFSPASKR